MGEVVLRNEGVMESDVQETEPKTEIAPPAENMNQKRNTADGGGGQAVTADSSSSAIRWERFLPKLAVSVLLVEADDSTRQIIASLLRKCSYKVAAVSDGLKAWEVLKARSQNIDLILTEVELPSISGYALLTLIREHDICKTIPVIMMSSHDSVSTVYKCMLRGAADFLVKPVRKNELRSLWLHVWRKQSSSASGIRHLDESTGQQKVEATAENNATSNHSSGYMACIQRNRECIEKGSDAQSSCTKPDLETERAKFLSDDVNFHAREEFHGEGRKIRVRVHEVGESQNVANMNANNYGTTRGQEKNSDNNQVPESSSREPIDLIGAFNSYCKGAFDSPASNASINRYVNKPMQPTNSTSPSTCNQQKDQETTDYNSDAHGSKMSPQKYVSVAGIRSELTGTTFSCHQHRVISQPIPPVKGVKFHNVVNSFGSSMPQIYSTQFGISPLPSPCTASHSPSFPHLNHFYPSKNRPSTSQQYHNPVDQRISSSTDPSDYKQDQKLENVDEREHASPANDQSSNSGFCCGSGKIGSISAADAAVSDPAAEDGYHVHEGTSHRSMQREAALMKFRLKRKDRCFEKKVRYESRKKLAEQRLRVKGQFVRQLSNDDPQPAN